MISHEGVVAFEGWIRVIAFLCLFAAMGLWEIHVPMRRLWMPKAARWRSNLALAIINGLVLRLVFPAAAVGAAVVAQERQWGLFQNTALPYWLALASSVVLLDFAIYLQHRMVHAVPWLWRVHRTHHADLDIDVTTGLRFHPVEILLSMLFKFAVIFVLGSPVLAVLIFEITLNGMSMFNHANVRLPPRVDAYLRQWIVTPDMHRVHHSVYRDEHERNFGFCLSVWDRLLRTYRAQPRDGHQAMTIGIDRFRELRDTQPLGVILRMPFLRR